MKLLKELRCIDKVETPQELSAEIVRFGKDRRRRCFLVPVPQGWNPVAEPYIKLHKLVLPVFYVFDVLYFGQLFFYEFYYYFLLKFNIIALQILLAKIIGH